MTRARVALAAALALALGAGGGAAAQSPARTTGWVPAWIASPAPARFDGTPEAPLAWRDQTIRQDIRLGVSARAIRLRISNELGTQPLRVNTVTVRAESGATALPVTFSGQADVQLAPGVVLLSDPVALPVARSGVISVSLRVPDEARGVVRRVPVRIGQGDATPPETAKLERRQSFVSAVYAETDAMPAVIVALGDSITEGATATLGAELDWPAVLGRALEAACPGGQVVLNAGISGNQMVRDGRSPNVRARLDRDVLALPGVTHVILLAGINDIRHNGDPANPGRSAEEVIAAYRQVIDRLHLRGIKVLGGTVTAFEGSERFDERSEAARQALNAFMREGGAFDGVVDFDAALRDPDRPTALAAGTHRDDRLHPNDEGYRRMAAAVSPTLFEGPTRRCG